MRQVRFLPALLLTILMSACNDEFLIRESGSLEQGSVSLSLTADSGFAITKADDSGEAEAQPTRQDTLDQFWVEIYKKGADGMKDGLRLYRKQYSEAKEERILLNAGDYYMRAKFGDSLGVGFTKQFLMAEQEFTVPPQQEVKVEATAFISNVKVTVKFGDYFQEYYPDYYVLVENTNPKIKNSLKFTKDETRSGYIHHGELAVYICADFKGDGNWKYYQLTSDLKDKDGKDIPMTFSPKDHFIIDVDAKDKLYGNLLVNVYVNDETVPVGKEVEVPEYKAPQDAPMASRQGFDVKVGGNDGYAYVYEGREPEYNDGQSFSYSAKAGLKSCVLNISSDYLKTKYGLDGNIELAKLSSDNMTIERNTANIQKLEAAGIRCSMGQFMGIVDFTEVMKELGKNSVYKDDITPCAVFSMTITDEAGATASTDGNMLVWPLMEGTFAIPDYDVWGWKVAAPKVNLTKGKAEYCQLQFSEDGKVWTTIQSSGTVSGKTVTFADKTGLTPDTDYWFRTYDPVGEVQVGESVKVHTEVAQQLGNPSFEEFRVKIFEFEYWSLVTKTGERYWYELFNSSSPSTETQWATNSTATMLSKTSPEYLYLKCYPTITLQKDAAADGSYYIMIASIATAYMGQMATNRDAKTGEVWIGEADNSGAQKGNHTKDGDEFTSRPAKLTFQHKFSQNENDPYLVTVQVWDSNKNVIGSGELSSGTSVEPDWKLAEVPITYSVKDKAAAYIYVSFKSSATGSTASRDFKGATGLPNTHVDKYLNSENNETIRAGSILWVDDVRLVYSE